MSWRTALCGLLQNEQRYSRLLKKSNNETSRFTHIARSPQKEVPGSAFALACRTTSSGALQTDTVRLAPPTVAQRRLSAARGRIYAYSVTGIRAECSAAILEIADRRLTAPVRIKEVDFRAPIIPYAAPTIHSQRCNWTMRVLIAVWQRALLTFCARATRALAVELDACFRSGRNRNGRTDFHEKTERNVWRE
jgi:hypothetical protein